MFFDAKVTADVRIPGFGGAFELRSFLLPAIGWEGAF